DSMGQPPKTAVSRGAGRQDDSDERYIRQQFGTPECFRGERFFGRKCPPDANPEGMVKPGGKESKIRVQVKKPRCPRKAKQRGRNREEAESNFCTLTEPK